MLIVETISKIRRLAHVQGKTIKAICRELGVSRKVVRRVLRSEETELNSPEFRRHPQVRFSAAFRTRRATASRF
nr:helix-turn-helix domain-containing protein [Brucella anthropi]